MTTEQPLGFFSQLPERLEETVTLPSGRSVTILETTGLQENIFRGLSKEKPGVIVSRFLAQVTKNLDNSSNLPEERQFDEMLQWDRTAILLHVRVLTHGAIVNYKIECTNCQHKSEHEIDLTPIIASIKPYPFGDKREFSLELDGGVLHFELPNGEMEKRLADMEVKDLNRRLYGLRLWEETPKGRLPVKIENLRSRYIAALRKKLADLEAQIDSTVTLICTNGSCRTQFNVGVVENPDFLFPNLI